MSDNLEDVKYDTTMMYIFSQSPEILKIGGDEVTAEKLVAAVLNICIEDSNFISTFDLKNSFIPLIDWLGGEKRRMISMRDWLRTYLTENGYTEEDIDYYRKKIREAVTIEYSNRCQFVHSKVILECIINAPSLILKNALKKSENVEYVPEDDDLDIVPEFDDEDELFDEYVENREQSLSQLTFSAQKLQNQLKELLIGQDNAINTFVSGFFHSSITNIIGMNKNRPAVTYLFAGPPGVGKTFLAETAARLLGRPFKRFDMSEFADKEANFGLIGSNKIYKSAGPGLLTDFVDKNPNCILLFDEIEKAHPVVIRLFLQILDAGKLADAYTEKVVSFSGAMIIMTTNAGRNLYDGTDTENLSGISKKVILNALQNDIDPVTNNRFFPAAICSRFAAGNVVMFNHLSVSSLKLIAEKEICNQLKGYRDKLGIDIQVDEKLYWALIFSEGINADARTITSRSRSLISNEIFELTKILTSERLDVNLALLKNIDIDLIIPEDNPEIKELFYPETHYKILLFSDESTYKYLKSRTDKCEIYHVETIEAAREILDGEDITFIIADPAYGLKYSGKPANDFLNIEDMESFTRKFIQFALENHTDTPLYVIQCNHMYCSSEEELSYTKMGVRGVIDGHAENDTLSATLYNLCEGIYREKEIKKLTRANKVLNFKTAQLLINDTKAAIKLFDFSLVTAVDAGDRDNILADTSKPKIKFDDVIGANDAKEELAFFVNYLKNPKKFVGTGLSAPKGVLLYGPPGTGKTMLARAMAGESDVTFIATEGNRFLQKYIGAGPSKIHTLFRSARKYAPAIVFIDEIDSIGAERTGSENSQNRAEVLTALLTEMDGFNRDLSKPVFVLAATNYMVDGRNEERKLDPALTRRFDRRIYIDLPNKNDREKYIAQKISLNHAFNISADFIENISDRSFGMSLAQLESVLDLSLRMAVREGKIKVTNEIFDEAFELFKDGEEKKNNEDTARRIAIHESGHTLINWLCGEHPAYVTITSRGNYGGYMQHDSTEDKIIYTKSELINQIRVSLGGRAAEIVYYGDTEGISTGASGDFQNATNTVKRMICSYGMSEKLGPAVMEDSKEFLNNEIYEEINTILEREMKIAINMITVNRPAIDALVDKLLNDNHITQKEIEKIMGKFVKTS